MRSRIPLAEHARIEREPGHRGRRGDGGRGQRRAADRLILDAHAAGQSELQTAKNFAPLRTIERSEDDAAVEVLVVIVVDGGVVGVAIGNRDGIIEAVAKQLIAVDHDSFIPLRHELIHHRAFHGGNVTVLDQVLVAEGLLELARLELESLPIMDVHVGVGDRFGDRSPGEIRQQAELVVIRHVGLDAKPGAADEERVGTARGRVARHGRIGGRGGVDGIEESAKIGLELARDPQLARAVGGLQEKALVPAREIGCGVDRRDFRPGRCQRPARTDRRPNWPRALAPLPPDADRGPLSFVVRPLPNPGRVVGVPPRTPRWHPGHGHRACPGRIVRSRIRPPSTKPCDPKKYEAQFPPFKYHDARPQFHGWFAIAPINRQKQQVRPSPWMRSN